MSVLASAGVLCLGVFVVSVSRFLSLLSLFLAVALVVASVAGAVDVVFFLVDVRRVVHWARLCVRCARSASACLPLLFS